MRDARPKNGRARTTTLTLEILNASIGTIDLDISIDGGSTSVGKLFAVLISPLRTQETITPPLNSTVYSMPAFGGESLAGIWTLEITGSVKDCPHVLDTWSLVATPQSAGASAPETAAAADAALLAWIEADLSDDEETDLHTESLADDLSLMLVVLDARRITAATHHHRQHEPKHRWP